MKKFKKNKGWYYLDKIVLNPGKADITFTTEKIEGQASGTSGEIVLDIIPN